MIRIRRYQPADVPQMQALHGQVWEEWHNGAGPAAVPISVEHLEERFLKFWVAIEQHADNEDLVGMVGADLPGSAAPLSLTADRTHVVQLSMLRIAADHRRKGIGTMLCGMLIDWARETDREAVITNTLPVNQAACTLFRNVGFTDAGSSLAGNIELSWFDRPVIH